MWKSLVLGACALAASQQSEPVKAHIELIEAGKEARRFDAAEIRLCDVGPGAWVDIEIHARDRRTKVTLHNVRSCAADERPTLTFSATQCVINGMEVTISVSQHCTWE